MNKRRPYVKLEVLSTDDFASRLFCFLTDISHGVKSTEALLQNRLSHHIIALLIEVGALIDITPEKHYYRLQIAPDFVFTEMEIRHIGDRIRMRYSHPTKKHTRSKRTQEPFWLRLWKRFREDKHEQA
jgi:hypothetical protein